jgi:hypothetical protein
LGADYGIFDGFRSGGRNGDKNGKFSIKVEDFSAVFIKNPQLFFDFPPFFNPP